MTTEFAIQNPYALDLGYARADEYFSSVWMMREETLFGLADRFQGMNIAVHVQQHVKQASGDLMSGANPVEFTEGGIAVVTLAGPLMKQVSSLSGGTSTVAAKKQIRAAAASKEVQGILLRIESPGGTSAGTKELADEVAAAAKKKPVWAYAEDLMASAAYWVGSQAAQIFANPTAIVGSIGTYAVIRDLSGHAAQLGVKVHVIRAGEMKGAGEPGTEVTPAMLADWQKVVDSLNGHFIDGVASGRKAAGLSRKMVEALADGRVHVGQSAVEMQLIDGVQSYEKTLAQLTKLVSASSPGRSKPAMSTEIAAPVAATFQELKASLPGADSAFREKCQDRNLTIADAQAAWMEELSTRLDAKSKECDGLTTKNADLEKQLAEEKASKSKRPGQQPLADSGAGASETSGDPLATWNAAIDAEMASGKTKPAAVEAVVAKQPHVHRAFVEATQPGR